MSDIVSCFLLVFILRLFGFCFPVCFVFLRLKAGRLGNDKAGRLTDFKAPSRALFCMVFMTTV